MATFIPGALITAIRGTIGGVTFSENGSSIYARQWSKGPNPRTTLQNEVRTLFGSHTAYWRDLSSADKATWTTYAAAAPQAKINSLGETYYANALNWYVSINSRLEAAGLARRDIAPTNARPAAIVLTSADCSTPLDATTDAHVYYTNNSMNGSYLPLWATFTPSSSRLAHPATYTLVGISLRGLGDVTNCGLQLEARFGDPTAGWRCHYLAYRADAQGQWSVPAYISCVVA